MAIRLGPHPRPPRQFLTSAQISLPDEASANRFVADLENYPQDHQAGVSILQGLKKSTGHIRKEIIGVSVAAVFGYIPALEIFSN
jgi:hypothetical protein